ncbi:glycosyltransferase [Rivularia sp. PCC 7116]|uniref:glycosyltransferase family 4 protein n=1 Tax=Rivularia sp. PCC 7116 TaxID=373994 RepID=UPI00029EC902|nr:glycosyltransferase family 4 protein [Rivularia sp. PCC 7116]AFY52848.1 glycosyltransferase [Rivularia sp. PCC 7116]
MRIAQVAPLRERVPPPSYGGIELVVSHLTDELVRRGHEVTLFASGDSLTEAKLEAVCDRALRLDPNVINYDAYELLELSQVYQRAAEFDVIHSHLGVLTLASAGLVTTPTVHTLHHSFNPDTAKIYTHHYKQPYISISNAQRKIDLNYIGTVYNGIDENNYPFVVEPENPPYLAFLGRFSPQKGPHHAISIAKQTGWHLKMAGKVDDLDRKFFEQEVAPYIDGKQIQYLGEVSHNEKAELLGRASVTLFPITWEEPFGLVMIESMATGTPVIATNMGSVPEVVKHGVSGFICQSHEDMASLIPQALQLSRYSCRKYVEDTFTIGKMVDGYEAIYRKIIENRIQKNGFIHSTKIKC